MTSPEQFRVSGIMSDVVKQSKNRWQCENRAGFLEPQKWHFWERMGDKRSDGKFDTREWTAEGLRHHYGWDAKVCIFCALGIPDIHRATLQARWLRDPNTDTIIQPKDTPVASHSQWLAAHDALGDL